MSKKDEQVVDGLRLLQLIANKDKGRKAAEGAMRLFESYFETKIMTWCDIHAQKLGYDENVAFEAIQCTFNKVWLYPTFDMRKSRSKDEERAIILWLQAIAASQMHQFSKKGVCAQINTDEDLIQAAEDRLRSYLPGTVLIHIRRNRTSFNSMNTVFHTRIMPSACFGRRVDDC